MNIKLHHTIWWIKDVIKTKCLPVSIISRSLGISHIASILSCVFSELKYAQIIPVFQRRCLLGFELHVMHVSSAFNSFNVIKTEKSHSLITVNAAFVTGFYCSMTRAKEILGLCEKNWELL